VRGWPEVLGYGELELEDGELYGMDDRMDGGLLPEPVPATLEASLSRIGSGALRFKQVTRPDPAAMAAALTALRDDLFSNAPPREREVGGEAGGFSMADTLRIVFDGETGMPISARIERLVEAGEGARGNVITIERRAP